MTTPRPRNIDIPGVRLAALEWGGEGSGAGAATPLLALHGWLDNAASFLPLVPRLRERVEGLHVVAVDLAGHGRSEHRHASAAYHYVDWIRDVVDIVDALGWDRFSLLGHSMGAGIASLAGAVVPERIERMALIEGLGPLANPPEQTPAQMRRAVRALRRWLDRQPGVYPSVEAAVARKAQALGLADPEHARGLVDRSVRPAGEGGGVVFGEDPRLRATSLLRLTEPQILACLRAVTAPVLLIEAEDGLSFGPGVLEARAACLQEVRHERVAGGHHLHLEHPERVAPLLADFIGPIS